MVIVLSVIGLVAAAWVWQNVHPLAGVVVGFLFVGGLGWKFLGFLLGLLRPSTRQAYGPEGRSFIPAWEARFGRLQPGSMNHPPPGTFQRWLREHRRSGISADDWLDDQLGARSSQRLQRGRHQPVEEPAKDSVQAVCEVLSYEDTHRPKVLTANDQHLRITEVGVMGQDETGTIAVEEQGGSLFAELTWEDILSWNQHVDEDTGEPFWILTLEAGASVPSDIDGLDVTSPSDEARWIGLLRDQIPPWEGSADDPMDVG